MYICSYRYIICLFLLSTVQLQYDNNYEVGEPHEVNCTLYAYTSEPVNSSDVSIIWSGPNGVVVANESSKITVIPTTSNRYNHTSTLQFSYISEDDEDTSYNCTTSLSEGNKTLSYYKSFTISNLTGEFKRSFYSYSAGS